MLFGKTKTDSAAPPPQTGSVFDATTNDFEQRVLLASMEKPVVVDFWAPWCGPCKQLGPVLEKAVNATGGAVLMARVDVDQNQELAAALRVQSIPAVFAFFQGRPVDAFQGAQPESQIKAFVERLVQLAKQSAPDALNIPEALKAAAQALANGDLQAAQAVYMDILQQEEKNVHAYVGLVRVFIAAGNLAQAEGLVKNAPPDIAKSPHFDEAKTALELAQGPPAGSWDGLAAQVEKAPDDHQARYDLAAAQFAAGQKIAAIENLLEIVRRNRGWNEDAARKQLVKFFEAMGHADPLTVESRKKLSSLLFS